MTTPAPQGLKRWLREPILHFVLIGAVLFFVYGRLNPGAGSAQRIVVTQAVVDDLARQYQARWMRPASQQELANLVEAHVRDEILYREGVALGLDQDDPVIKRRVRQKLEVMSEEPLATTPPSDADLSAYMAQNADRFRLPARLSFEQVYFDGAATAAAVERTVAATKSALARGASPALFGRPTLLPREAEGMPADLVARDFGPAFAQTLVQLPLAEWAGPVASSLGAHLVRVSARTPAGLPTLDDVRQQVAREWENTRRERSRSDSYTKLRSRYDVVMEPDLLPVGAPRP
jgi:parvulin-like peptidyl-prolyl isomerase